MKLSLEQEHAANWAINATGPTQVKGSPGTGKSTVALYRVKSLIQKLQETGQPTQRILYTTYTNALVRSSDQQLKELLGEDSACVDVMTADLLVWNILSSAERKLNVARDSTLIGAIERALQQLQLEGSTHPRVLERLNRDYLLEEICQVIIARKITTEKDYQNTKRKGRRFGLTDIQREAVWKVYEIFLQQLNKINQKTWQQVRLEAEKILEEKIPFGEKNVSDADHAGWSYDALG